MRIADLTIEVRRSKGAARPIRDALQSLPGSGSVHVTARSEDGVEGHGSSGFGRIAGAPDALAALVEHELKPLVVGTDLTMIRATHESMLRETEYHGSGGLTTFGIAAVDTALWDCYGRTMDVPCWNLWGGVRSEAPAYAMVGWINYSDREVRDICAKAVAQGFRAVKVKVGYPTLAEDIRRVEAVRSAVGADTTIMVDANQSLTTADALVRGRAFEDMGLFWWEEPIPADDIDGYAELADALDIPVATGENLYSRHEFARFLRRGAVDVIQPDLRRAGGPTMLLQIGLMADCFRIPYASHGGGPVQLNVMACLGNAIYLETGLIPDGSPMRIEHGKVSVPDGPGFSWG